MILAVIGGASYSIDCTFSWLYAALPPDVRKGSAFPVLTFSFPGYATGLGTKAPKGASSRAPVNSRKIGCHGFDFDLQYVSFNFAVSPAGGDVKKNTRTTVSPAGMRR
jgi:hypothetical protein